MVSVIVPVAWDAAGLAVTLRSVCEAVPPPGAAVEVIVANDGADPAVSAVCRSHGALEIAITPNRGSYHARNRALAESRGAWIAFTDADVAVAPGWLTAGVAALQGGAGYVCGRVEIDPAAVRTPAHRYDQLMAFPVAAYLYHAGFGVTANLFVRRSLIEQVGGFDERLRSGGDLEFGRRVRDRVGGASQLYAEAALIRHPPRDLRQQIAKTRRVVAGQQDLAQFFPERFGELRPRASALLRSLLPPRRLRLANGRWRSLGRQAAYLVPLFYLIRWRLKLAGTRGLLAALIKARAGRRGGPPTVAGGSGYEAPGQALPPKLHD